MHAKPFFLRIPILLLLLVGLIRFSIAGPPDPPAARRQLLERLIASLEPVTNQPAKSSAERPRISTTADGYVRFIGAPASRHFRPAAIVPGKPEVTARGFLREYASIIGVASSAVDFKAIVNRNVNGRNYVRFQQVYSGIPVFCGEAIVQVDAAGGVQCLLSDIAGNTQPLENAMLSTVPRISAFRLSTGIQATSK